MLVINPLGGLANRMRVIASAMNLVRNTNVPIKCLWWVNAELGASFYDLFEPIPDVKVLNVKEYCIGNKDLYKKIINRLLNRVWNVKTYLREKDYAGLINNVTKEDLDRVHDYIIPILEKGSNVRVNTCSILSDSFPVDMFRPILPLQNQINEYSSSFSKNTYGIHIRRTDNTWAIENSPLELFIHKIEEITDEEPDAKFYLATDDAETINFLKNKFAHKILVREKDFSRATEGGIKDAVIDMWLLSKTKKIYGSFYSSFSEMAAWIGGIELKVVIK